MTSPIGRGGGVKNCSKLPMDSTKKLPTWGRGVSKIRKKYRRRLWMVPNAKEAQLFPFLMPSLGD